MSFDVVFGLLIILIVVVLGGLLAIYLYVFFIAAREKAELKRAGVTTEGAVTGWQWQGSANTMRGRSGTSPLAGFITYRFRAATSGAEAQEFTHTDNVWVWTHWRYPVGGRLPVRYLPGDPTTCQIG